MTLRQAQTAAADLRVALLDHGVRSVSIELQQGVAGSGWGVAPFKRGLGHHIVSRPPGTPGLAVVKNGRKGASPLQGPLSNGYGGFDLIARIITMGWANHPGAGGPWSVPGWGTVPRDNGRPYVFGWEFEGGLLPYTDEMHDFMARCGAGTLDWLGTLPHNPGPAPLECWDEHLGWAGRRKVDRLGYTTASGRARIAAVRAPRPAPAATPRPALPTQEDPMLLEPGKPVHVTVPFIPPGYRAVLVATGQSDSGAVVYSKGLDTAGNVHPVITRDNDWTLWLGPGFRAVVDVSALVAVELVNNGAKNRPDALAGATISVVPVVPG